VSITVTYQITGYSADGKRWRSRAQMLRRDGAIAATVTTNAAWFGLRSRRIEAPPPELVSVTDSIKSDDFVMLEGRSRRHQHCRQFNSLAKEFDA
jgi:hypothetical protein